MYVRTYVYTYVCTYVCAVYSLQIQINARIVVVGSSDTATSFLETLVTAKSVCVLLCVHTYVRIWVCTSVHECMSACVRTYSVCIYVCTKTTAFVATYSTHICTYVCVLTAVPSVACSLFLHTHLPPPCSPHVQFNNLTLVSPHGLSIQPQDGTRFLPTRLVREGEKVRRRVCHSMFGIRTYVYVCSTLSVCVHMCKDSR